MQFVVIGGSVAGLVTALFAARHGHDVTVLERDAAEPPDTVDGAWRTWNRRVPQFRQFHGYQSLARDVLCEEAPDIVAALKAEGAYEATIAPATERDAAVVQLRCRRVVLELVLRRAILASRRVRFLPGVTVAGLLRGADATRSLPTITGIVTDHGEEVRADLVVDASGRRSSSDAWLGSTGCTPARLETVPTGQVYFTRWYRAEDPERFGGALTRVELDFATCIIAPADHGWFSVTFFAPAGDAALRTVLGDGDAFHRAALSLTSIRSRFDQSPVSPQGDVMFMGGLANQLRLLTESSGPVAAGLVAVADALLTTNPTWGRGVGLAFRHAADLIALCDEANGPQDLAEAFHDATRRTVRPWFFDTLALDEETNDRWSSSSGRRSGQKSPRPALPHRCVVAAAQHDADVFQRYSRYRNLLIPPDSFWNDPVILERVAVTPSEPLDPSKERFLRAAVA